MVPRLEFYWFHGGDVPNFILTTQVGVLSLVKVLPENSANAAGYEIPKTSQETQNADLRSPRSGYIFSRFYGD